MTLAVNVLQESQEQAEHLQEFRTKNKEIVQENAGYVFPPFDDVEQLPSWMLSDASKFCLLTGYGPSSHMPWLSCACISTKSSSWTRPRATRKPLAQMQTLHLSHS